MQDIRETTSTKKPQTIITRCVYVIGIYVIESTVLCWSLRQSFVRLPDCWSTGLLRNINKIHTIKLLIVCLAVRTDKDATRHRCAIRRASRLAVDADFCPPLLEQLRNGRRIIRCMFSFSANHDTLAKKGIRKRRKSTFWLFLFSIHFALVYWCWFCSCQMS